MFETALFYLISFAAILSAVGVVTSKSAIYSVLCLVLTMCLLAGLFALLKAFLVATILVLVYAGAILVLFLFVVMLIDPKKAEKPAAGAMHESRLPAVLAGALSIFLFFETFMVIRSVPVSRFSGIQGTSKAVGHLLFDNYLLPFELTAFLILAAIVSVVVLAKKNAK